MTAFAMTNQDQSQRFLMPEQHVRGQIIRLNSAYQDVCSKHPYPENIRHLLGQTLLGACLITGISKAEGKMTLQFRGSGDLKILCAQYQSQGHIRGLAQYDLDAISQHKELSLSLSQGTLAFIYQPLANNHGYESIVEAKGNSISQSLLHYFNQSEQIPTALITAIDSDCAAAMMIQSIPDQNHQLNTQSFEHINTLFQTLSLDELRTLDFKQILYRLFHQEKVELYEPQPIQFHCQCSIEKMENAILTLGQKEALKILSEHEEIGVTCEFCNHHYGFSESDIERLFLPKSKPS